MTGPALNLISADEARRILGAIALPLGTEEVPLEAAAGRVLGRPMIATEDIPAFARAAMDGYAVRAADAVGAAAALPKWLDVVGTVPMGSRATGSVGAGQAMAIATGGHLPQGADAVVMIEHVLQGQGQGGFGQRIGLGSAIPSGKNVVAVGEEVRRGSPVLPAGRRLEPRDLGALAAFGTAQVTVHARPRVAVLSTGHELTAVQSVPGPGQVRDINQTILAAQAEAAGCAVTRAGAVPDDRSALESVLRGLLPAHDVVLVSGGSSIGSRDFTAEVFRRLGAPGILFHGIDVRPGKPTLLAQAGSTVLVGLPGVPASSLVIFDMFVRPLLWRLGGAVGRPAWSAKQPARLGRAYTSAPGREDYVRVCLVERENELWADPVAGAGGSLAIILRSDGLVIVPADVTGLDAGQTVVVCLFV